MDDKKIKILFIIVIIIFVEILGVTAYLFFMGKKGEENSEQELREETVNNSPTLDINNVFGQAEKNNSQSNLGESYSEEEQVEAYSYINPEGMTLSARINTPEGFERMEADGFGTFLRDYPMLEDGAEVMLYDGSRKGNQGDHVAVFDMDLVPGDLQQCADSCIRIYAEYLYGKGYYDRIAFHLVNGFLVDFDTWRKGGRVNVVGNSTSWVMSAEPSDSEETFEKYLKFVFNYASTLSMDKESEEADLHNIQAGDLFIKGGSPGHVVMVVDVCEDSNGENAFLLGQGYMPAQQFHVLKNPSHEDNPWYYMMEVEYPFVTPEYVFGEGSFKRPGYDLTD